MELDTKMTLGAILPNPQKNNAEPATSFLDVMNAKSTAEKNLEERDKVLAAQGTADKNINTEAMSYIREHGMQAYADKLKADKIEAMREELMAAMGLTEEVLKAMPPEQRMEIEALVDETIQQRIAANSIMNAEDQQQSTLLADIDPSVKSTIERLKPDLHFNELNTAQANMGFASSQALIDIIEKNQSANFDKPEDNIG